MDLQRYADQMRDYYNRRAGPNTEWGGRGYVRNLGGLAVGHCDRGTRELRHVRARRQRNLHAMRRCAFLVKAAKFLPQPMHFDPHHRVLTGVETIRGTPEKLRREVELRELRFLVMEVFLGEICQQPSMPSGAAQEFDGPLELLPFGARGTHALKSELCSFRVLLPSSATVTLSETSAHDQ